MVKTKLHRNPHTFTSTPNTDTQTRTKVVIQLQHSTFIVLKDLTAAQLGLELLFVVTL